MSYSVTAIYSPKPFLKGLCLAGFALALAACTSMGGNNDPYSPKNGGPTIAAPDTVTLRLAEAAEKAATSLDKIAHVEQVRTPLPAGSESDDLAGAPPELMEPVTITWYGPVEKFLATMAGRIGYRFTTTGAPPPVTLSINIDVYNQPLVKVLKSAALQVTGKADVVVDASRQLVEVRYAPTDAAPSF